MVMELFADYPKRGESKQYDRGELGKFMVSRQRWQSWISGMDV